MAVEWKLYFVSPDNGLVWSGPGRVMVSHSLQPPRGRGTEKTM